MDVSFANLVPAIPMFVIAAIGITLAWRGRKSQRRFSSLVIIGLSILFAHAVGTVLLQSQLYKPFDKYRDASIYAQHLAWVSLSLYILNIIGVAFVTSAAFAGRSLRETVMRSNR